MPNLDSQLNKDSWGWVLRLKFKKLCTSWPSKQPSDIKLNFEPCKTPQAKVLCMCCERELTRWVKHCAQVRWWTTTSSPPPSSSRWGKEKHSKNCESCPTQVSWKVKFKSINYVLPLCPVCSTPVYPVHPVCPVCLACPVYHFCSVYHFCPVTLFVVFLSKGSCRMSPPLGKSLWSYL